MQQAANNGSVAAQLLAGSEMLLVLFFGARMILKGDLTVGMLMAFQAYRGQFSTAATSLVNQFFKFRILDVHLERLADVVHADPELFTHCNGVRNNELSGSLRLNDASFRYADEEPWIFRGLNISIQPGEFVALVGPSGGGKSTLLKILMGLYPLNEGALFVDERPIDLFGVLTFRDQIGVVMQDDHLFAGTIADNIAFFDPDMDTSRTEEAARQAFIHDEIQAMPMGYMTLVGDLGSTLSGGQQQRILLARAFYRNPKIIFLDEGTANLDMLSERRVMQSFASLAITRVVVAHRPAAVEGADRIFSVQNGAVQELHRPSHPDVAKSG